MALDQFDPVGASLRGDPGLIVDMAPDSPSDRGFAARPRILFISPAYPAVDHPVAGIFVQEHAKAASLSNDVVVIHLRSEPDLESTFSISQDDSDQITTIRATYRKRRAFTGLIAALHWVGCLNAAYSAAVGSDRDFDVVHGHMLPGGVAAAYLSKRHRKPLVFTEHYSAYLDESPQALSRRTKRRTQRVIRRSAVVLPVSRKLRDSLAAVAPGGRFEVVPNAVDTRIFEVASTPRSHSRRYTLLTVGLLTKVKGVDLLLQALSLLDRRGDIHLDVVGAGPELEPCRQLAGMLGLTDQVVFHGIKSKAEVAQILDGADLFVSASLYETFGAAVIEALACGVPVLATRSGGPEETVTPEVGLLVEPGDPRALAAGIDRALELLPMFDRSAIAAYARESFGLEAVGARLSRVYLAAIGARDDQRGG